MCINFQKINLIDQSKPCTQLYLQNILKYINLQLAIIYIRKIMPFSHAIRHNRHYDYSAIHFIYDILCKKNK